MTEQERLHHLLDRMLRGVLLPAEGEALAGLVGGLEAELARLTAGQCTHYKGTHDQWHTVPVTGCVWCTPPTTAGCEHCGNTTTHLPGRYMKNGVIGYCRGELTEQQPTA